MFSVLSLSLSNILFGLVPALQKFTFPYGGSGLLTAFYASVFSLIPLWLLAKYHHISLLPPKNIQKKLLLVCLGSVGTILCLWSSYNFIPVGIAMALHYVYPIVIAVIMSLRFHEPFSFKNSLALTFVIIGITQITSFTGASISPIGIILALVSGLCWAFYIIYMEKSGICKEPASLVNFYTNLSNIPLTFLACAVSGQLKIYSVSWAWGIIILIALLHRVIAYALFQLGLRKVSPVSAGILCTFEPISALFFGFLLLGESLSFQQILGVLLLMAGIMINLMANRKQQ